VGLDLGPCPALEVPIIDLLELTEIGFLTINPFLQEALHSASAYLAWFFQNESKSFLALTISLIKRFLKAKALRPACF
jgi:hypothetical protein